MNTNHFLKEYLGVRDKSLLHELSDICQICLLKNGELLIRQGVYYERITFLIDGLLAGCSVDPAGYETVDCFYFQCGDAAIPPHDMLKSSRLSIKALEDSLLLQIPISDFVIVLKKYQEASNIYSGKLVKALESHGKIKNALQRYKGKDIYLCFLREYPGLIDRIPHKYIASFLGMTEVHFSRIHKAFSRQRGK